MPKKGAVSFTQLMMLRSVRATPAVSNMRDTSRTVIRVPRDLIRAGQLLKIEVIDHVIIGHYLVKWLVGAFAPSHQAKAWFYK